MPITRRIGSPASDWRSGRIKRDAAGDRGLEQQIALRGIRRREQLGAVVGQELLVGGDDGLARLERLEDELAGGLDAADHLDDDVDVGRGRDREGIGGELGRADVDGAVLGRRAHGDPHDLEIEAQPGGDVGPAAAHQIDQRGADVAAAEQADSYRKCSTGASLPAALLGPMEIRIVLFQSISCILDSMLLRLLVGAQPGGALATGDPRDRPVIAAHGRRGAGRPRTGGRDGHHRRPTHPPRRRPPST